MLPLRHSNHRSRQIVPQHQAQLSERHTAALLQWQPFAAILELLRFEISPRYVARLIPNNVRGISLSSNPSIDAAGVQAPATLRLTGRARLADDSTGPIGYPHSAITRGARRIPGNFFVAAIQRKRPQVVTPAAPFGRMLPLRQADTHRPATSGYPSQQSPEPPDRPTAPGPTERASYSRLVAMATVRGYPRMV